MAFKQGNFVMNLLLPLVISLLFLGSSTAHAQSVSGGELAMTGVFYEEYVLAESGEGWLGLYRVGDEYELRSTTLVVSESQRRGMDIKEVGTSPPSKPLFLVRGLEELKPGKVTTLMHDWKFLYPGQIDYFQPDGSTYYTGGPYYTLTAVGVAVDLGPSQVGIQEYRLILSGSSLKQVSQTLVDWDQFLVNSFPGVIWAGDLDKDGKLDLFMDMTRSERSVGYALFLSSAAKEGEFVGKVATWEAVVD